MIIIKRFYPSDNLEDAFWVRDQVFTVEQGFSPEIEIDEKDPIAHHVVIYDNDKPFATARTFPKDKAADPKLYIIGRVAILKNHRGNGTGIKLMEAIESLARGLGATKFELGAQDYATPFYEKCGFRKTEETYHEEHCKHVTMVK